MDADAVRDFYALDPHREEARLSTPEGELELHVTRHFLGVYLPASGRVLDLGGGTGTYSKWLLARGYDVVLADLTPALLDVARQHLRDTRIEAIVEADARDLSRWEDASFDAVLSLGPFYHLPDVADRSRAAGELRRVTKPNGIVFAAWMPRTVFLWRALSRAQEQLRLADRAFARHVLDAGAYASQTPGQFTHAYGSTPEEIESFMASFGFRKLIIASCEGIGAGIEHDIAALRHRDARAYEHALELVVETALDATLMGFASHLLYVGARE